MATPRIKGGIGADGPFWDALERGEFRISRCAECKRWLWPAHFRCGQCGSWDIDWEKVEAKGRIYTWTRNHAISDAIKERRADLPYVTMLVELPQAGGVRIPGVLIGSDAAPRIGDDLVGEIQPASDRSKGYVAMGWRRAGTVGP